MSSQQSFILLLSLLALAWRGCKQASADTPDVIRSQSLFFETFDTEDWQSRWKHSTASKYNGRFTSEAWKTWTNKGLKIPEKNKYYGLAALLPEPVDPIVASAPKPLPLVVQYEVKYSSGITCGGSYLKLLTADETLAPEGLVDSTPYSIMFGPDRCGGPGKVHLIFRHRNPHNGTIAEKHLASPPTPESNDYTHIYTLRLFPDHKYEVLIDGSVKSSGSLLDGETLAPSLVPPPQIPDPEDKKPANWVDLEEIPDPDAVKPADWDDREQIEDESAVKPKGWNENEPELINDPAAKRPSDWDEEEDGEWEPNQIPNPKCKVGCGPWKRPMKPNPAWKGAWKPPLIANPDYKGPWIQRLIPNPHYFEEKEPLRTGVGAIGGVALELWTVDSGYMFDNILITRDPAVAELALNKLWKPRNDAEVKAFEEQLKASQKEEEEKKKKKEANDQKSKKSGKRSRQTEQLDELVEKFLGLFEAGKVLAPLAPVIAPVAPYLRENPQHVIMGLGLAPLLVLAFSLLFKGFGGRQDSKPSDETESEGPEGDAGRPAAAEGAADEAPEGREAEAGEEKEEAAAARAAAEEDGAAAEAGEPQAEPKREEVSAEGDAAATKEEQEEEEEGEEDEAPTGPRRRTRRAA